MRLLPARRRTRVAIGVVVAALMASATYAYRPWESHFKWRPTSWWAEEIMQWEESPSNIQFSGMLQPPDEFRRRPTRVEAWLERIGIRGPSCDGPLPLANPAAVPVLCELLSHPDPEVRSIALVALEMLDPEDCRPALPVLLKFIREGRNSFPSLPRTPSGGGRALNGTRAVLVSCAIT